MQQQQTLAETLSRKQDSPERMAWLIDQARRRPKMDARLRLDAHRVEGCLARLWLVSEFRDGCCQFQSESDSLIVKSVAGLLCEFYSGHSPAEILAHPPEFLGLLGINQHLTATRRNGLSRVWETIREFAASHVQAHAQAHAHPEADPGTSRVDAGPSPSATHGG